MPVNLPVRNMMVRSLDVDHNEFSWEVEETREDVLDYTFQVLRSEAAEGPYDPVTGTFEDRYVYLDSRIPGGYKWRELYYKLRVTQKSSGDIKDFGPTSNDPLPDVFASYIRYAEYVLFSQAAGRRCWVFPLRTFGTRCTSCWDYVTHQKKRSLCLDCFDTGFLRGYLNPVETWVQIDPSAKRLQLQTQQQDQQNTTQARAVFYPKLKPGDVLVEAENRRWRIVQVVQSERLRATVKQELMLREIQPTDIEYRLPVNISADDLRVYQPGPARMYTNPQNLDSAVQNEVPNPFAIYNTGYEKGEY